MSSEWLGGGILLHLQHNPSLGCLIETTKQNQHCGNKEVNVLTLTPHGREIQERDTATHMHIHTLKLQVCSQFVLVELWPFNGHFTPPPPDVHRGTMTRKHQAGFFTSLHQRPQWDSQYLWCKIYNQKQAGCKQGGGCWSLWWMMEVICGVFKT